MFSACFWLQFRAGADELSGMVVVTCEAYAWYAGMPVCSAASSAIASEWSYINHRRSSAQYGLVIGVTVAV
jgi:hypothetical protein